MIPKQEMIGFLYGAYRLLMFDPRGINFFTSDKAPARRSFWVPFLAFPYIIFIISFLRSGQLEALPLHSFVMAYTSGLLLGLGAFYLITHLYLEMIYPDKMDVFPRFVTSLNWSFAMQALLKTIPVLLHFIGLINLAHTTMLLVLLSVIVFVYKIYIAKLSMGIHWLWAIGLIFVETALGDFFSIMTFASILRGSEI